MIRIISLVLFSGLMSLFFVSPVWAEQSLVFSANSMSEFEIGQYPFINGKTVDSNGNPLSDVEIQVNFPSLIVTTLTNSAGEFSTRSSIPAEVGQYTVTIYATMNTLVAKAQLTYQVVENQPIMPLEIPKEVAPPVEAEPKKTTDGKIELDPFSKMLLQIEKQKVIEEKKIILSKQQQFINEQRQEILDDLEQDLERYEKQQESYSLKNAYLRFLVDIDSSFKNIFWQQFLFTEKITNEALEAKENALEEGKSSDEATKIFQHKASVTRNEVVEYLKNLNIKNGSATSSTQEQLNEAGKIQREE